jgi:glycosyltransferase involved in cell wall biosynthesis
LQGFVVLYAGNFSEYVNFEQMFEAAKLLRDDAAITFVLIGDGMKRVELEQRIKSEGITNTRILPKVAPSAMGEVMAASDACLVSLDGRMLGLGCPSKLYTILASGRPVLGMVPAQSEVARVILEEQCGLVVNDGDAEGLARAVRTLAQDPELAATMGAHARSALEHRFTLQHASDQFWRLFNEITPGPQMSGRSDPATL